MKNTLVVTADLGGYKAFRLDNDHQRSTPRLQLLEHFDNAGAHTRIVDSVTDLSGRFGRGAGAATGTGAMSDGERHNLDLEWRKRLVRRLAQRLSALLADGETERCYLAASREINHQLLDELTAPARSKVAWNVSADLMKTDKGELLGHFRARGQSGLTGASALA